jgi:hypothetical protein
MVLRACAYMRMRVDGHLMTESLRLMLGGAAVFSPSPAYEVLWAVDHALHTSIDFDHSLRLVLHSLV